LSDQGPPLARISSAKSAGICRTIRILSYTRPRPIGDPILDKATRPLVTQVSSSRPRAVGGFREVVAAARMGSALSPNPREPRRADPALGRCGPKRDVPRHFLTSPDAPNPPSFHCLPHHRRGSGSSGVTLVGVQVPPFAPRG
jgi:hypothetical protein